MSSKHWIRYEIQQPAIGEKVIGLNPVNKGSRSEYWTPQAMIRLDIESASQLFDDDFDEYVVESWYAPIDDISSDCSAPWLWIPFEFVLPELKPSEMYPNDGPYGP